METKSIFSSKTAILNTVVALSAFYPTVGQFVAIHPEAAVGVLAIANLLLRFATKKKVQFFPN